MRAILFRASVLAPVLVFLGFQGPETQEIQSPAKQLGSPVKGVASKVLGARTPVGQVTSPIDDSVAFPSLSQAARRQLNRDIQKLVDDAVKKSEQRQDASAQKKAIPAPYSYPMVDDKGGLWMAHPQAPGVIPRDSTQAIAPGHLYNPKGWAQIRPRIADPQKTIDKLLAIIKDQQRIIRELQRRLKGGK